MDVGLRFHYHGIHENMYSWDVKEICPTEKNGFYLKHMPYSSCTDYDQLEDSMVKSNSLYNVYVFSDRYSSTLQFLDDKG